MIPKLGRIERVDLRHAWTNEAASFTPWMASEEGMELLQDALGMDLEVEAVEQFVGPFRADIVAKRTDTPDEHWVLIENQLERTDHKHLGQLLTYAAGLKACTIVWVAREFEEEHRAALDWLNDITPETIAFWGLEVELWRIGGSDPAPMFNIIAQPNEWVKEVHKAADAQVSDLRQQQQRYWQALFDTMKASAAVLKPQKALTAPWAIFRIGRSWATLDANMNTNLNQVSVKLRLEGANAKAWFDALIASRDEIERTLGHALEWRRGDNTKRSQIVLVLPGTADPTDEADWPRQHAWMADALERMRKTFQERVRRLPVPAIDTTGSDYRGAMPDEEDVEDREA